MDQTVTTATLTVRGLTKRFGGLTAVKNLSFDLHPGEILGLIGPNGSGKSTIAEAVAEAYGAWGEKKNYGRTFEGLIRSTIVVGPDGKVTHAQYNVKATGHVARLRRTLGLDEA